MYCSLKDKMISYNAYMVIRLSILLALAMAQVLCIVLEILGLTTCKEEVTNNCIIREGFYSNILIQHNQYWGNVCLYVYMCVCMYVYV